MHLSSLQHVSLLESLTTSVTQFVLSQAMAKVID